MSHNIYVPSLLCRYVWACEIFWAIFGTVGGKTINETFLRFHVAMPLFSNRSQMTSKCGKNKKVAHEVIGECVTDVLTTF